MVKVDEAQESAAVPDKFEDEEHREHGGVKAAVYWQYIKAGRLKWWFLVILSAATFRLLMVAESWLFKVMLVSATDLKRIHANAIGIGMGRSIQGGGAGV